MTTPPRLRSLWVPGDRVHGIMQGVLQPPPLQGTGTTETRLSETGLHGRGCRAGTRPKLTDTTTKGSYS